jgi:ABC-2 type transport system ATP-binding protein
VTLEVTGADHFVPRLLADLSQAGIAVDTMQVRRPTLEDVFLKLTGRTIRDDEGAKDERRLTVKRMGRI